MSDNNPPIIRGVHVLGSVHDQRGALWENRNTREVQESCSLIFELGNSKRQMKEVQMKFIWMLDMEHDLAFDHFELYHQMGERGFFKILEVKKSDVEPVEDSGLELFACVNFEEGGFVTVYISKMINNNIDSS